jgi:hypothetical protein
MSHKAIVALTLFGRVTRFAARERMLTSINACIFPVKAGEMAKMMSAGIFRLSTAQRRNGMDFLMLRHICAGQAEEAAWPE